MKTVRGMQDFFGERAQAKQLVEDTCRSVFELYGFEPLDTPVLEELETLTQKGGGGEAIKNEIYFFKDKGDRDVGMRFDLTVPLARFVASNPSLKKPFKRYQIGKVWRYDRPQAGRFREFTQADIDIVGAAGISADFECIAAAAEIMKRLFVKAKIRVNNKKLLQDFAVACGIKKDETSDCFRCIDKLDKIGLKEVEKELREKKISPKILEKLSCSFDEIKKIIPQSDGVKELQEFLDKAKENGLEEFVVFDVSLARGLEYYNGNVFEVSAEGNLSIGGGGRYDNLIESFGGQKTPAVGISFGVERMLELVSQKQLQKKNASFFVGAVSKEFEKPALRLAQKIRALGLLCETDLMQRSISKNIEYAQSKKIAFVIFIGEDEEKEKAFKAKNLSTGKETKIRYGQVDELKKLI